MSLLTKKQQKLQDSFNLTKFIIFLKNVNNNNSDELKLNISEILQKCNQTDKIKKEDLQNLLIGGKNQNENVNNNQNENDTYHSIFNLNIEEENGEKIISGGARKINRKDFKKEDNKK